MRFCKVGSICICAAVLLSGCMSTSQDTITTAAVQPETAQTEEPKQPVNEGNVLTNRIGYEAESQKLVIFRENHETNLFEVVNAQTEEVVYRGTILEKEYNLKSDEFAAYGDFSKVTEPGEYYINAGEYGISDSFRISKGLYEELLQGQMAEFMSQTDVHLTNEDAAVKVADMLLAYNYFPGLFQSEGKEQLPEILQAAGEDLKLLLQSDQKSGVKTAVLAMAVNEYAPYDQELAEECRTKAEEDFPELKEGKTEGDLYWAAAELYKLTGKQDYRNEVDQYLEKNKPQGFGKTGVGYLGTLAYLTTTYKTDVDRCTELMEQLFDDAIEIVEQSSADGYKISLSDAYQEGDAELLLQNARLLTLMNIISKSKDYVLGSGNHLDYLCGRNPFDICYLDEENELYQEESLIFLLSGLTDSYESEETKE